MVALIWADTLVSITNKQKTSVARNLLKFGDGFFSKKYKRGVHSYNSIFYSIRIPLQKYFFFCKLFLIPLLLLLLVNGYGQNRSITINNGKVFYTCGVNCTDIKLQVPNLRGTGNYKFSNIPYSPYAYSTTTGIVDSSFYPNIGGIANYSKVFSLPFNLCFYDSIFSKFTISTNGVLTFDTLNTGFCPSYINIDPPIPDSFYGPQCNSGTGYYSRSDIFGIYTDLEPSTGYIFPVLWPSPPDRKIERRTEGIAPFRQFIISYYHIGTRGREDCSITNPATFQIVLYESTGVVEIYIDNFSCPAIYGVPKAICGMQNWDYTKAVTPPGKNATLWTAHHEAYRFTPSVGASRLVSCELQTLGGSHLSFADSSTDKTDSSLLNLQFSYVCPVSDTNRYLVKTSYTACPSGSLLTSIDTVTLIKTNTCAVTVAVSGCGSNTTITANTVPPGLPMGYALDSGVLQSNNVFTNVSPGIHTIQFENGNPAFSNLISVMVNNSFGIDSIILKPASCYAAKDGKITLYCAGPAGSFQYSKDAGASYQSSNIFDSLTANIYFIRIKTASGCTKDSSITITQPPQFLATAQADSASCTGNDGKITITVNGGVPGYQYSINNGSSFQASNLFTDTAGIYPNILVKDTNGCIAYTSTRIFLKDTMRLSFNPPMVTICADSSITLLPNTNPGTNVFLWQPANGLSATNVKNPIASPSDTTTYWLTARWGNCSRTVALQVQVLTKPIANAGADIFVCNNAPALLTGTASHLSGTVNYLWNPADSLINAASNSTVSQKKQRNCTH